MDDGAAASDDTLVVPGSKVKSKAPATSPQANGKAEAMDTTENGAHEDGAREEGEGEEEEEEEVVFETIEHKHSAKTASVLQQGWRYISTVEELDAFVACLNVRGIREFALLRQLEAFRGMIEESIVRNRSGTKVGRNRKTRKYAGCKMEDVEDQVTETLIELTVDL